MFFFVIFNNLLNILTLVFFLSNLRTITNSLQQGDGIQKTNQPLIQTIQMQPQQQVDMVNNIQQPVQQSQPSQPPPQQQQHRGQIRNPPSHTNVQSYLKLSSPVVLNHELLASYGVSLNGQQNPIVLNASNEKNQYQKQNVSIRRDDNANNINNQKIISGKYYLIKRYPIFMAYDIWFHPIIKRIRPDNRYVL